MIFEEKTENKRQIEEIRHLKNSKSSVFVNFSSMDEAFLQILDNSQQKNVKKQPSEEEKLESFKRKSLEEKENEIQKLNKRISVIFFANLQRKFLVFLKEKDAELRNIKKIHMLAPLNVSEVIFLF